MLFKLQLNGINLILVNPAFTAKVCYNCNSFNTVIRDGYFKCNDCSVRTSRSTNTLFNILNRYNDSEIKEYTKFKDVKRLLEHRKRLSGATKTLDTF